MPEQLNEQEERRYENALYARKLEDGQIIVVYPMLYTYRLCIGPQDSSFYDRAWCYQSSSEALEAAASWDGDAGSTPPGDWVREL